MYIVPAAARHSPANVFQWAQKTMHSRNDSPKMKNYIIIYYVAANLDNFFFLM